MQARLMLWLIAAAAAIVATLHMAPLFDLDETIYAQTARDMQRAHSWLIPIANGEPFFEKPPLFFDLLRISFALFGENAFAARLPSALATIATALMLAATLRAAGRPQAAAGAALAFLSMLQVQMLARAAILDATLNLALAGAFCAYLLWLVRGGRHWLVWAAAASGLAVAIKGPVGAVVPAAAFLFERWLAGGIKEIVRFVRAFPWGAGLAAFLLTAAPLYLMLAMHEGLDFFVEFVIRHNLERALQPMQG
ncbi:MAG: phospholipid carrier-dependent glycosyltransferase, partial [Zetaproteobacteria bacterium]